MLAIFSLNFDVAALTTLEKLVIYYLQVFYQSVSYRLIACEQALYSGLTRDLIWARAASGGGRIGAGLKSGRERIGAGA